MVGATSKPTKTMFNVRLEPSIRYQAKMDAFRNRMTVEEWVTHCLKLAHELDKQEESK